MGRRQWFVQLCFQQSNIGNNDDRGIGRRPARPNSGAGHPHPPQWKVSTETIARTELFTGWKYGGEDCQGVCEGRYGNFVGSSFGSRSWNGRQNQRRKFPFDTQNQTASHRTRPRNRSPHRRPSPHPRLHGIASPPMHRNRFPRRGTPDFQTLGRPPFPRATPRRLAGGLSFFGGGGGGAVVRHWEFAVLHHESDLVCIGGRESWGGGEERDGHDAVGGR